jgi:predicted PurR-regulated permease PerM
MAFAFLGVLGIPFALTLAIIAGIFEAVPMVGAYLGAIPAVLVALTISPVRALIVAIGFTVIQQLEGNIIVPQVMRRAIGVHPMVILIAALMGGTLFGFAGVLIAIPVTAAASVIWASMRDDLVEKATAAVHEQKGHK